MSLTPLCIMEHFRGSIFVYVLFFACISPFGMLGSFFPVFWSFGLVRLHFVFSLVYVSALIVRVTEESVIIAAPCF